MDKEQKNMLIAALDECGECTVRVEGTSMWPFIRSGDRVVLHRSRNVPPQNGAVIGFFIDNQLVIHRIAARRRLRDGQWRLVVLGDSMPGSRSEIEAGVVAGVVSKVMRNGKTSSFWVSRPFGVAALWIGKGIRAANAAKRAVERMRGTKAAS